MTVDVTSKGKRMDHKVNKERSGSCGTGSLGEDCLQEGRFRSGLGRGFHLPGRTLAERASGHVGKGQEMPVRYGTADLEKAF